MTIKQIKTVGVVGAGTMGSAIAQKFAQEGFDVVLNDREQSYVDRGISGIRSTLEQAVEKKIFKPEVVHYVISRIKGTSNPGDLGQCDLIIEAVYEDFNVKCDLFRKLDQLVPADTILATNTSSFSVSELAKSVSHPERFVGLHYFYHAAKNRLVEIVPGKETSHETFLAVKLFCSKSSKDPIVTRDTYGFAVNRFFVPWLNESVRLLESGSSTIAEIDAVCIKTLGIGMGPFALMNATGIPITLHTQNTLKAFGPSYSVANLLEAQVASGRLWDTSGTDNIEVSPEREKLINERLLGSIFFVCTQIINEEVCTPVDLNRGARIGLKWKRGPVELMNRYGLNEVQRLVNNYRKLYGENDPGALEADSIRMNFVTMDVIGEKAIINISKPEDLNVLNAEIIDQLEEKFALAESLPSVKVILLTGSGKAFVAGADVKFFVNNIRDNHISNIVDFTARTHRLFNRIDESPKRIVAVLNGMALGGGMELALCCDQIMAFPDIRIAFPETGIGIYPGLGGTQRTMRKVGKGLAKYLVLTGKAVSSQDAFEMELIDNIIDADGLFSLCYGEMNVPEPEVRTRPDKWTAIEKLFGQNHYKTIMNGTYHNGGIDSSEVSALAGTLNSKAPVALDVAEELMEKASGTQSELDYLEKVFSTRDALLGLTTLGRNAVYSGG